MTSIKGGGCRLYQTPSPVLLPSAPASVNGTSAIRKLLRIATASAKKRSAEKTSAENRPQQTRSPHLPSNNAPMMVMAVKRPHCWAAKNEMARPIATRATTSAAQVEHIDRQRSSVTLDKRLEPLSLLRAELALVYQPGDVENDLAATPR
jgi:hypothetical protein